MISCGEASGDLYAGALTTELHARQPDAEIFGFGGPRLKAAGGQLLGDFGGLSVTGLTEAIRVVPRSFAMLRRLVDAGTRIAPDVFVPIDFPDFNFRLMAALRRLGIPIVYYVSPQLWAWRPGRMETMQRTSIACWSSFRSRKRSIERRECHVQFVGHPLVDLAKSGQPRSSFLRERGLVPDGADRRAAARAAATTNWSAPCRSMVEAMPLIRARVPDVQFVVACAPAMADCCLRRSSPTTGRRVVAGARSDRRRARGIGRGDYRLGHGDRAVRAARAADGRCLSAVAADLSARASRSSTSTCTRCRISLPAAASCPS